MLTLYRRHKPTCPHFSDGRKFHHCKCAIWADGILGGQEIRRSMRTRDWTKANREVQKWEAAERMSEQRAPVCGLGSAIRCSCKKYRVQNGYRFSSSARNPLKTKPKIWRRGWDSNPRMEVLQTCFKT